VTEAGIAEFVNEDLGALVPAMTAALASAPHMPRHLEKLNATAAEERHLFTIADIRDLPFKVFYPLAFGDDLPPLPPPLPRGVTHLWLAPTFSFRGAAGQRTGWTQSRPYDR
jgi:hypothetical protein